MGVTVYWADDNLLKNISSGESLVTDSRKNVVYAESSDLFSNPERGFMTYTESHYYPGVGTDPQSGAAIPDFAAVNQSDVSSKRTNQYQSLVFRYYYMEKYKYQDTIDQAYLNLITADLNAIRAAGCKAIVRFAYSRYDPGGSYNPPYYADTTPTRTFGHVTQLLPIMNANADVIISVNAGLIGIWGEWYYTENWGNTGNLSAQNWSDRVQLLKQWVDNLDSKIMVNIRYPAILKYIYEQGWITISQFNRIGIHNDAFMASDGDWGTFDSDFRNNGTPIYSADVATQRTYLTSVAGGKLIGGESANAGSGARTGWSAADTDMTAFRFSYLNPSWKPDLYDTWGSNITIAKRKLGYRLTLDSGTYSIATTTAGTVGVKLKMKNTGYSAPIFNRPVQVVFVNGGTVYTRTLSVDIRSWVPGGTFTIDQTVSAPATTGTFNMFLALPDPDTTLGTQAAFSIRLANQIPWDATNGRNDLQQTVVVS